MQKIHLIVTILVLFISSRAHSHQADRQADRDSRDSLFVIWLDETNFDSIRVDAYNKYINSSYFDSRPDSLMILAHELIEFGIEQNYHPALSIAYELKGNIYEYKNNFSQALESFKSALTVSECTKDEFFRATMMNNIGVVYQSMGNYTLALEYYEKCMKTSENIKNLEIMEMSLSNIGEIYLALEIYPRALEYLSKGLHLEKEMGDSVGYAMSLNLMASVYSKEGNFDQAFEYSERAMKIFRIFDFTEGLAYSFFSFGDIYKGQKKYDLAIQYFNDGLELYTEMDDSYSKAEGLFKIGLIYQEQGAYSKALTYCQQSETLASTLGMLFLQKKACECLYTVHRSLNNVESELKYLEQVREIDRSLNAQETNKKLQQMEFEKRVLQDSIANAEETYLIEKEHQIEIQRKDNARNIAITGALFILLAAVGYMKYIQQRNQKQRILEVEKFRSKLSANIHDDVGSMLSNLALESQLVSIASNPAQREKLESIANISRKAMENLRDTVWAIDARKDRYENLMDRMIEYGEDSLSRKDIDFEVTKENWTDLLSIDPEKRHNVYLIFKEAITNILKHSSGDLVSLRLNHSSDNFEMRIKDNGSSDQNKVSDGLGLSNMKMRAESLAGTIQFSNEDGFEVCLTIPI